MNNDAQELRDPNGQVVGYFLSAQHFNQLEQERQDMREQNERLHRHVRTLVPVATPEMEAEMAAMLSRAVPFDVDELFREIESDRGH